MLGEGSMAVLNRELQTAQRLPWVCLLSETAHVFTKRISLNSDLRPKLHFKDVKIRKIFRFWITYLYDDSDLPFVQY